MIIDPPDEYPPLKVKQSAVLLTANSIFIRCLSLLAIPIITRLYSPSELGIFATYLSFTALAAPLVIFGLGDIILVPKKQKNAKALVLLGITSCLLVSIILCSIGFFFWDKSNIALFIPLACLLSGIAECLNSWIMRSKAFADVAKGESSYALIQLIIQINLALYGFSTLGLILGDLSARGARLLILMRSSAQHGFFKTKTDAASIIENFRKYYKYALQNSGGGLIASLNQQNVIQYAIWFTTLEIAGYISLVQKALESLVRIAKQGVLRVTHVELASYFHDKRSYAPSFLKSLLKLLAGGMSIPFLILTLWGQPIFSSIFGSEWITAGYFVKFLSPHYYFILLSSVLLIIPNFIRKPEIILYWNTTAFILSGVCLAMGHYWNSIYGALIGYTSATFFSFMILLWWVLSAISESNTGLHPKK